MKASGSYPRLLPAREWWDTGHKDEYRERIKSITFLRDVESRFNVQSLSWDVSEKKDGGIRVFLLPDSLQVFIVCNGSEKIAASNSIERMFDEFTSVERIEGLGSILDTSDVTNMKNVFRHCCKLTEIDVSEWDVSNVTSFRGTFCCGHNYIGDAQVRYINITGWNVSNATDMANMFYGCGKLEKLDITDWDVSKVTNFRHTFADCFSIKEIDVSRWNTKSVVTLDGIFNDCRSVKSIDISGWNTSNCMEFDQFFDNCISLEEIIGINRIDTTKGISFEEMFNGCRKLKKLDLSSINTKNVDGHMFTAYSSSLEAASNMKNFLNGCNNLRKLKCGADFTYYVADRNKFAGNQILEKLNELGYIIVSPVTGSMCPIVRPKTDHVVFKKQSIYKRNDIVLFQSENHKELVMHRIVRKFKNGYLISGDNTSSSEFIPNEFVFAGVSVVYRGKLTMKRNSLLYWLFSLYSTNKRMLDYQYHSNKKLILRRARKIKRKLVARIKN